LLGMVYDLHQDLSRDAAAPGLKQRVGREHVAHGASCHCVARPPSSIPRDPVQTATKMTSSSWMILLRTSNPGPGGGRALIERPW